MALGLPMKSIMTLSSEFRGTKMNKNAVNEFLVMSRQVFHIMLLIASIK